MGRLRDDNHDLERDLVIEWTYRLPHDGDVVVAILISIQDAALDYSSDHQ